MDSFQAAPSKTEINTFFGRCRCCLEYGYLKNMWSEYYCEGVQEIYGEMLMETFSLTWDSAEENKEVICESCVQRLRDACNFKREVLASENLMCDDLNDNELSTEYESIQFKQEVLDESEEHQFKEEILGSDEGESGSEYCEVEYLEDEYALSKEETSHSNSTDIAQSDSNSEPAKRKPKWPRKKKRTELTRIYKNYTEEDMKSCLDLIRENQMTVTEACKFFGIPRKTVSSKLLGKTAKKEPETPEEIERQINQEKQQNFIRELKQFLSFTNAVPFKVKGVKYFCAHCYINKNSFEDPDELRLHAGSHKAEWLTKIENILKPYFLNEILRMDIEALRCTDCNLSIKKWEDTFKHMKEVHELDFEQCRKRLIPFKLKRDFMHCVICEQKFPNFSYLDSHMNAHFANYMCADCGDTFLAQSRLKHHVQIHISSGKFTCDDCGKNFTLDKYLRKHIGIVHKKIKSFKCMYCPEKFHSDITRHTHVVESHKEKVRESTCEFCGKTFTWRAYYVAHLRKVHSSEKKNRCRFCPRAFVSKHELKMHEQRHTGTGKHYCNFCGKNFVTMMELKSHMNRHAKEIAASVAS